MAAFVKDEETIGNFGWIRTEEMSDDRIRTHMIDG
jgi:hypothetical protein